MRKSIIVEQGFSLVELLIVVAIILVLAVIAVPSLLRSKIAANEASALQTVRQIATAEMSYSNSYPDVGFAPDLASLGGPVSGCSPTAAHACILDSVVSSGNKGGYNFFAAGFTSAGPIYTSFVASSAPQVFNTSGVRMFCIATDGGAVRSRVGAPGLPPAPDVPTCIAYQIIM
jgi:prepilin-type N-terminal cleavage/methylation domain-containing protein